MLSSVCSAFFVPRCPARFSEGNVHRQDIVAAFVMAVFNVDSYQDQSMR